MEEREMSDKYTGIIPKTQKEIKEYVKICSKGIGEQCIEVIEMACDEDKKILIDKLIESAISGMLKKFKIL